MGLVVVAKFIQLCLGKGKIVDDDDDNDEQELEALSLLYYCDFRIIEDNQL